MTEARFRPEIEIGADERPPAEFRVPPNKESTRCPMGGPGAFRRGKKPLLIPEPFGYTLR